MSFESVCKFYSYNRNCKFGKNCKYLNSDNSQRPPPLISKESNGAVKKDSSDPPQSYQSSSAHFQTKTNPDRNNHEDSLNVSSPSDLLTSSSDCQKSVTNQIEDDASQGVISQTVSVSTTDSDDIDQKYIAQSRNVCRYFKQHGYCAFGRNCRFFHSSDSDGQFATTNRQRFSQNVRKQIPPRFQNRDTASSSDLQIGIDNLHLSENPQPKHNNVNSEPSLPVVDDGARDSRNASRGAGKICRYFKSGYCSRGRRCMFLHQRRGEKERNDGETSHGQDQSQSSENDNDKVQAKHQKPVSVRPIGMLPQVVKLSDLQANGTEKYRQYDLNYLKKRFQAVNVTNESNVVLEDPIKHENIESTLEVTFSPSDPDWPFDVKTFILHLELPNNYPEQAMSVAVPSAKQDLPETVRRYLEICLNEWISDRQKDLTKNSKSELMVRPFFRWLDRNFEEVMTEALKQLKRELTARAAGFEFIPATHLKAKYAVDEEEDDEASDSQEEATDSLEEDDDENSDECLDSDDGSEESREEEGNDRQPGLDLDTDRRGTEIQLRHLQLKQNASSLLFEKLHLLVQCARCKNHSEVSVGAEKAVGLSCDKCNQDMFVQYRPMLVHQFSSVIGYLDLDNCQAFDLIFPDCKMVVSCLSCGKLTKINGMTSGQMVDGWCQACNARFKFASEAVKFYQLQPSNLDEEKKQHAEISKPKGNKKPPKDPAIREGEPLPEFGTCRHYKQSYRWLRFPCCGKAYPCDVCHDKKEDHEMILANRMICGHCCKEQNYSATRPCNFCGHHMTKIRSAHWEGGMGCRDKIAMSRNDQQKYKNMNKTVSRKKVSSGTGNKKKNTKLRHT